MANFLYHGTSNSGEEFYGIIESSSCETAISKIEKMGIDECDVYETMTNVKAYVPNSDIAIFAKQLSIIYRTNISLIEGLLILKDQTQNRQLQIAILEVHKLISDGYTLGRAITLYPHIFGEYFIKIVNIAELSGNLEDSFKDLFEFYKNRESISKKIKNSLVYPSILLVFLFFIVIAVVVKVVPIFNELLISYGIEISKFSRATINILVWVNNNLFWIIALIVLIFISAYYYFKSYSGKIIFNNILQKSKIYNRIETKNLAVHYSKSVASLLKSGMIYSSAVEFSNTLVKNTMHNEKFKKVKDDILKGEDFDFTIQEFGIYSTFSSKMLCIGNETGTLDEAFLEVSEMLKAELEEDVDRLQRIFEPIAMLILGGIVIAILISVALPMINILENII